MICKHGKKEIPTGDRGHYFICHLPGRLGRPCIWSRWDNKIQEYVSCSPRNGAICCDMELVDKIIPQEPVIVKEEKKKEDIVIKKRSYKSSKK